MRGFSMYSIGPQSEGEKSSTLGCFFIAIDDGIELNISYVVKL